MQFYFDEDVQDEYVRILSDDDGTIIIAISSMSKKHPGLWMNDNISTIGIVGVDEI